MLVFILLILIILWFLGYGPLEAFFIPLFTILGRTISLWDILIFLVILGLIGALPRPFREISSVLLFIWVLSLLGFIAIAGLSSMLVIAVIVGLLLYLIGGV